MISNCWIEAYIAWKAYGGELVFIPTRREYKWMCKFPHAFVRLSSGIEIEFVPLKETLGNWPLPLFRGKWQIRGVINVN